MSINPLHLCEEIIKPALEPFGLYSPAVEQLLLGTAAKESRLGFYLRQVGGPALGIYQIEPATHKDIWDNFLAYKKDLRTKIALLYGGYDDDKLVYNLRYATLMARIKYLRSPIKMPEFNDIQGQANLWKEAYNTKLGKGTAEQYIEIYKMLVSDYYAKVEKMK